MTFGKIKVDTSEPQPHVIPEVEKHGKSDIRMARKGTHKYNTRSRVNHVTTFKNTPKTFKMDTTGTSKTYIGTDYIAQIWIPICGKKW